MSDIIKAFNDWQRKDIERMKAERLNKEKQKLALISLLAIVGISLCGLSFYYKPLLFLGVPFALIGGISFGKLINKTI
jgi:hypothetical protein